MRLPPAALDLKLPRLQPQDAAQVAGLRARTAASVPSARTPPAAPAPLDVFTPGSTEPAAPIVVRETPALAIPDRGSVTRGLELPAGATVASLELELDVAHTWRGDLRITLTSPDGTSATVLSREGGSADDVRGTFDVSEHFRGQKAGGRWELTVEDLAGGDLGTLNAWGLSLKTSTDPTVPTEPTEPNPPTEPTEPAHPDADPLTHLAYLGSPELEGRGSPSEGYDQASLYVAEKLEAWGALPGNPENAEAPFFQSFEFRSGWPLGLGGEHDHEVGHSGRPEDFSSEAFEHGFYVTPDMSAESLAAINAQLREQQWAQGLRPRSGTGPNGDLTAEELMEASRAVGTVQNVVGRIEGTGPNKDQTIVLMAHLDHVGVNSRGVVHPGADDNASGSSVMLSLLPKLQQLQAEGKLDRSIVLVWTAAEEEGLVGANYLRDHPLPGTSLEEIDGVINMDMLGRWDDERLSVLHTTGGRDNYWAELVEEANGRMDNPFDRLNRDINAFSTRQDGAVFTSKGEDVLMLFEGLSRPEGGGNLNPDYHRPTDTIDRIYEDNGGEKLRRAAELIEHLIELASNRPADL